MGAARGFVRLAVLYDSHLRFRTEKLRASPFLASPLLLSSIFPPLFPSHNFLFDGTGLWPPFTPTAFKMALVPAYPRRSWAVETTVRPDYSALSFRRPALCTGYRLAKLACLRAFSFQGK